MFDIITIGSATLDAFIETKVANIVSVSSMTDKKEYMSYPYGSKIDIDEFKYATGGGAVNAATNLANLGFKVSPIVKIGNDIQGKSVLETLDKFKVDKSNIVISEEEKTGFSVILTSFQGDRTVLAHRGPNANICNDDINFDSIKSAKWLYIAPLNGDSTKILDRLATFAEENNVNMAINVGTSSIKKGAEYLDKILKTAEVVILNLEEASMLTSIVVRPDNKVVKYSTEIIHPDIKEMLNKLKSTNAKIVVITDGKHGVYAFDNKKYYQLNPFPANVISTLGAGDAFASTFVASLEKTNWDIENSLKYASVNAASVVENFGAQEGFLTFAELQNKLKNSPDYQVNIV